MSSPPVSQGPRPVLTPGSSQPRGSPGAYAAFSQSATPRPNGGVLSSGVMGGHAPFSGTPLSVGPTPRSSGARQRRDLGGSQNVRVIVTPKTDASQLDTRAEIWGTTVNVDQAKAEVTKFFRECLDTSGQPLYPALLSEALDNGASSINLNLSNLHAHNPSLYRQLVMYPQEIIPIFDVVLAEERELLQNPENDPALAATISESAPLQARPFGLVDKKGMRSLNPEDMDTLVAVKGMVIRVGGITPEMQRAYFQCSMCAHGVEVPIDEGVIAEPVQCANCQSRHTYALVHNRCRFNDKQLIKVQETPDSIPEGETPHSIKVFAFDELVDCVKPGDRVEITGIYKAVARKVNPRRAQLSTVYATYVDAVHFKKTEQSRMANEASDHEPSAMDATRAAGGEVDMSDVAAGSRKPFDEHDATAAETEALEARIKALAASPDIYERLTRSLAPSIWEMEDVKKGVLCLLFGGSGAEEGAASGKFRGEINVLMCGDPGTSKSQLMQYVHKIAPRGIYTSGKGSSAVGLTASVVKDAESREMVLESGALVLSDRGVCCIDEFDKMSDATRSILHEVMEQQTVSIAKAGIVCTLNARTSILASANPKESRYNPKLSVVENVQIMPTLLSRFDLIYLVLDQPNEGKDRKLAKHLVSLYHADAGAERAKAEVIPMHLLTAYISYARRHCRPVLSNEAEEKLIEFYTAMRQQGGNQKVITATPRQLEALIRLSEALAKMKLKEVVDEEEVHEAKRLMDVATQRAATDPTTGRIDMDLLATGHSSSDRMAVELLSDALRDVLAQLPSKSIRTGKLLESFNDALMQQGPGGPTHGQRVSMERLRELLHVLEADQVVRIGQKDMVQRL